MSNEHHINRIIKSYRDNPDKWLFWHYTPRDGYSFDNVSTAYNTVLTEEILNRMKELCQINEMSMAVRAALLCLVAFDDCGYMLDSEPDELNLLCKLSDKRAILLYWACHILKETK